MFLSYFHCCVAKLLFMPSFYVVYVTSLYFINNNDCIDLYFILYFCHELFLLYWQAMYIMSCISDMLLFSYRSCVPFVNNILCKILSLQMTDNQQSLLCAFQNVFPSYSISACLVFITKVIYLNHLVSVQFLI